MRMLVDTNVVVHGTFPETPSYEKFSTAVQICTARGHELVIVPQIIEELWAVATRPAAANGVGLSVDQVNNVVTDLYATFTVLFTDGEALHKAWRELVVRYEVKGRQVFDAKLAAAMNVYGLDAILTADARFSRFGVKTIHPDNVSEMD